jgi:hypothetical protein
MSDLLAQIVLAQRDVEEDGWTNILVVIVMIVFWTITAVVKAMKTKSEQQERPSRVPNRKPPVRGRAGSEQRPGQARPHPAAPAQRREHRPATQTKRTTLADLREAARKFAAEAEQAFQPPTKRPIPTPPPEPQEPPAEPEISSDAVVEGEPVVPPIEGLAKKQAAAVKVPPSPFLSDLLSDYADRDKLRRAILHYEILGPPLSLRD